LDILKIWQGGLSLFGGFIGAIIASIIYVRINKIDFWGYANAIMYGFPLGLGIGRIGCFINHLHLGKLSNFPLAVAFPDGSRLDMGLIESIFGFLLFAVYFFRLRKIAEQIFLPVTMIAYGAVRFVLDFARANDIPQADIRYLSLTPAQYGSVLLILGGIYIFSKLRLSKASPG
jgi:phosphatidylglycerol:prolipoprotein diacylglycerol transferase